jgi:PAS domain S-box-containing protein
MSAGNREIRSARDERDDARAQFEITFDANPAPSAIMRLSDGVIVKANPGLPELSGRANRELEGKSAYDSDLFISRDTLEQAIATLSQGKSVVKVEVRLCSATEGERITVMSANPIELEGDPCGIFNFTDITDLKRAEELFTQVFRLTPIPVVLIEAGDGFLDVNQSFEALTGYGRNEVMGRSSAELKMWSSADDRQRIQAALEAHGEFRELELTLRTKEGQLRQIVGSGRALNVDGRVVLLHIFSDITERKRSDEQFHKAVQQVMNDTSWFSRQLLAQLATLKAGGAAPAEEVELSRREQQVLARLANGLNNEAIGEELGIATQTVRNYISTIYDKLNVHSRAEAVVWARERGII